MIEPDAKKIKLTQGEECFVSAHRFSELNKKKWYAKWTGKNGNIYAARTVNSCKTEYMHRVIAMPEKGFEVDHEDGNTMNNCDSNLKIKTKLQNLHNRFYDREKN